jgi:cytidylate kinase
MPIRSSSFVNFVQMKAEQQAKLQIMQWKQLGPQPDRAGEPRPFVTLSREYGTGAYEAARLLVENVGPEDHPRPWVAYGRDLVQKIAQDHQLHESLIKSLDEGRRGAVADIVHAVITGTPRDEVLDKVWRTVRSLAEHGHVVIIGRAGNLICRDLPGGVHVRLVAPLEYRVERVMERNELTRNEALHMVELEDQQRRRYVKSFFGEDIDDQNLYDVVLNSARLGTHDIVDQILALMQNRGWRR